MKACKQSKQLLEASNIGIKYLTLYAFSTENWSDLKAKLIIL